MAKRGPAAAISIIAGGLLEEAQERRKFRSRLESAILERGLDSGELELAVGEDKADLIVGGYGFKKVGKEESLLRNMENMKKMEKILNESGVQGNFIPKLDPTGRPTGYNFHQPPAAGPAGAAPSIVDRATAGGGSGSAAPQLPAPEEIGEGGQIRDTQTGEVYEVVNGQWVKQ